MRKLLFLLLLLPACAHYDTILRNGTIYDGSGGPPVHGDVAIRGQRIAAIGHVRGHAAREVDVHGLAVAPGFINMLSWATESLIVDGRAMADVKQGVTLEVFGEGWSMGPLNDAMKRDAQEQQGDIKYTVDWTTLRQYLDSLVRRGVSVNVASFLGATTVRIYVLGEVDRAPNAQELDQMRALVRQAMEDGAFGIASALIYPPGFYAKTTELVELCKAAAPYGGMYISHMRSEGNRLDEAVDELLTIAREANVPAEIYHLKAAGQANWPKLDATLAKIEAARAGGQRITANMYTYTAGATSLGATMPPWVQEGGFKAWRQRLMDPAVRERVIREMRTPSDAWENLLLLSGSPERVLLTGFKSEKLKPLTGKTLAEVARMRGVSAEDAIVDLVIEDESPIGTVYFIIDEDNLRKELRKPWVSFGSDAAASAPEGVFLKSSTHPREYGNFANLLGKYVRDEQIVPLEAAVRRLTALPASNLGIADRGLLRAGNYADVVVFDPATVAAHATYDRPFQYATGMVDVFVNGTQVLRDGEHTGAKPGQAVLHRVTR
ncbi:MAG: D-aminoacylase [Acidobacteria bacterium]|nr:D-aminoacylase [Acidobacteriota bacterium]MBV9478484.1 D-aminoacylase [Acidobacteriota bacterium]